MIITAIVLFAFFMLWVALEDRVLRQPGAVFTLTDADRDELEDYLANFVDEK